MRDWFVSLGKSVAIAAAGAGLTALVAAFTATDFGPYTVAVMGVLSVAVSAARKALEQWAAPEPESEGDPK